MFLNTLSSTGLGGVLPEDRDFHKVIFQPSTSPFSLSVYILEKKNSGDNIILVKVTKFSYIQQHDLPTGKNTWNRDSSRMSMTYSCLIFFVTLFFIFLTSRSHVIPLFFILLQEIIWLEFIILTTSGPLHFNFST